MNSKRAIENLTVSCAQAGYLRIDDVADVVAIVGPVEIVREDQVKQVIVRGDAQGVSVDTALAALQTKLEVRISPPAMNCSLADRLK